MWLNNILETIGNTPLIKLNKITKNLAATVLAKVDYFNPGNSVKDRMALKMVEVAKKEGKLKPGGTKLFVMHVGLDSPEMQPMEDYNVTGPKDMGKHRNGELNALTAPSFQLLLKDPKYRLVNYRTMINEKGLASMKRPPTN